MCLLLCLIFRIAVHYCLSCMGLVLTGHMLTAVHSCRGNTHSVCGLSNVHIRACLHAGTEVEKIMLSSILICRRCVISVLTLEVKQSKCLCDLHNVT